MKAYKSIFVVLGIVALLWMTSCGVKREAMHSHGGQAFDDDHPQMVFVEGLVRYDSVSNTYSMQLLSMTKVDGRMKQLPPGHDLNPAEGFNYVLRGKGKYELAIYGMENPLRKRLEYVDENGSLGSKEMRSDEADFYLRIPLTNIVDKIEFRYKQQVLLSLQMWKSAAFLD